MFNLLPPEQKRAVRQEYHLRLATTILLFLSFTGLVFLAFLFPSFFKVNIDNSDLVRRKKQLEEETPELREVERLQGTVLRTREKLGMLKVGLDEAPLSLITDRIVSIQPNGAGLRIFSFSKKDDGLRVKLTGQAATRNVLLDFVKKLEEENLFSDIDLPVSDLAKDRDVSFSVSFNADI